MSRNKNHPPLPAGPHQKFRELLARGQLFLEKCELLLARDTFLAVLDASDDADVEEARISGDISPSDAAIEAVAVLLRLSAEAQDATEIARWNSELEERIPFASGRGLVVAWHNRGVVATYQGRYRDAQVAGLNALKAFRASFDFSRIELPEEREALKYYAKIWVSIAATFMDRKWDGRALHLSETLYRRFGKLGLSGELAQLAMVRVVLCERKNDFESARRWVQEAHSFVLADRNWYFFLYVLWAYARIERKTRNFAQAYSYLDMINRAASGPEFGVLHTLIERERNLLSEDAVDLLIDARRSEVKTREKRDLSLGKQYVLLGILEALTEAHHRDGSDSERGLSKGEIIEKVWKEPYRPESHDNKLYYNINRIRKLIEPDMRHPKYLLNWKEGYRLAPGLKVHLVGGSFTNQRKNYE